MQALPGMLKSKRALLALQKGWEMSQLQQFFNRSVSFPLNNMFIFKNASTDFLVEKLWLRIRKAVADNWNILFWKHLPTGSCSLSTLCADLLKGGQAPDDMVHN